MAGDSHTVENPYAAMKVGGEDSWLPKKRLCGESADVCKSPSSKLTLVQSFSKVSHVRYRTLSNRFPWHIMSPRLAVPPGGSTLVLTSPTEWFPTKPKIDSTQKPLCLSMLGDAQWNEWMGKLQNIVNQYLNERLPVFFLAPFGLLVIFGVFLDNMSDLDIPVDAFIPLILLQILGGFAWRACIVTKAQGAEQT